MTEYRRESLAGDKIDWGHSKCVLPTLLHTLATVWEAQAHFVWLLGEAAQHPGFPLGPVQSAPRRSQLPRGWGLAVYSGRSPHLGTEPEAGEAVLWSQGPLSTLEAMGTGESDQQSH